MTLEEQMKNIINLSNTYIGECPPDADNCQWIRESAGTSQVYFNKDTYDKLLYTIYIRGKLNAETYQRTQEIFKKLQNYTEDNCSILVARLPHFAGKDDRFRSVYSFQLDIS